MAVAAGGRARARDRILHRHPARRGSGFTLVPYSLEYQNELRRIAAALLREAAGARRRADAARRFSTKRADALLSNDYYDSDVAWMELKGAIEPTIGPYEVYEDEFFNYKAAFESFITVRDEAGEREAAEVQRRAAGHREPPADRSDATAIRSIGALAPLVVVNEIFAAGDANRGVQTAAFNLPNDERVLREKGAKRVMLKNVQDAKFAKIARADLEGRAGAGRPEGICRSKPSSRTS